MKKITNTLLIFLFALTSSLSQTEYKILDSQGLANDNFGYSAAISGEYAIVGSPYHDIIVDNEIIAEDQGKFIFYKLDDGEWTEQLFEEPTYYQDELLLGLAVDIDKNYAIITAPWADVHGEKSGMAGIYQLLDGIWTPMGNLVPTDPSEDQRFGISAAINGDYAIVGAFFDDAIGDRSGSAYIFKRDGESWYQQAKLVPEDGAAGDWFGVNVDIHGNYAAVGSRYNTNENGSKAGAVYIYKLESGSWYFIRKLIPYMSAPNVRYEKPALSDNYVAVGAPYHPDGGVVYFTDTTQGLLHLNFAVGSIKNEEGDNYGQSLAIYDTTMIVGAPNQNDTGAVYIYSLNTLKEKFIVPSKGAPGDKFGAAIDIDSNYMIVGACGDNEMGENAGAIYIYNLVGDSIEQADTNDSVTTIQKIIPDKNLSAKVFPNPFKHLTNISYTLEEDGYVLIEIYNITGEKIKTLMNSFQNAGKYTIGWNGTGSKKENLPVGYYLCKINTGANTQIIKLIKSN